MIDLETVQSSNAELEEQFANKLIVNPDLTRALVSFQANKKLPGHRWFKYKEGFSAQLIHYILNHLGIQSGTLLDPFAGSGTALFVASKLGYDSIGIELLPIGCEIIKVQRDCLNGSLEHSLGLLQQWVETAVWQREMDCVPFPHLRITQGAFSADTEAELQQYLSAVNKEDHDPVQRLLRFAALCVLEEISYTRKDGQYLRWDYRADRSQGRKKFDKGKIKPFRQAIVQKLKETIDDICGSETLELFPNTIPAGKIEVFNGSCLKLLPTLGTETIDCIITSPPYCNRYDYTRTYALELAMLGITETGIRNLRQELVSCTVENREKPELKSLFLPDIFSTAVEAFETQENLQKILAYLEQQRKAKQLNNPGIVRMVRNYFFELSLIVFECARILKPGSCFVMVNDNVRYQGAEIPVDLILSDIASKAGFEIEKIWVLPTGKGNSSQQMRDRGRKELRKCVYLWRNATRKSTMKQDLQLAAVL